MELKVVKKDDKTLIVEVAGESVTFCNMVAGELWNDSNVREATYVLDHPQLSQPQIVVKVSRGSPENALRKAAARLEKKVAELGGEFDKALKK